MSRTFSMPIRQPWFFIFLTLSLNVINASEELMIDMVDQIHDPEAKKKYLKQIVKNAKIVKNGTNKRSFFYEGYLWKN